MAKKLHPDPVTSHFAEMLKIQSGRGTIVDIISAVVALRLPNPAPAPLLVLRIWLQL